jgi:hypothetical protein
LERYVQELRKILADGGWAEGLTIGKKEDGSQKVIIHFKKLTTKETEYFKKSLSRAEKFLNAMGRLNTDRG